MTGILKSYKRLEIWLSKRVWNGLRLTINRLALENSIKGADVKLITVASMANMLFSFNYAAGNQLSPSRFFDAGQRELAVLIKDQSLDEIKEKAVFTDLNSPGREGMTLLIYSLLNAVNNKTAIADQAVSVLVRAGADPLFNVPYYGSAAEVMATSDDSCYLKALIDGG